MTQLADKVRQVEPLKAKKSRASKNNRKERVIYVEMDEDSQEICSNMKGVSSEERVGV